MDSKKIEYYISNINDSSVEIMATAGGKHIVELSIYPLDCTKSTRLVVRSPGKDSNLIVKEMFLRTIKMFRELSSPLSIKVGNGITDSIRDSIHSIMAELLLIPSTALDGSLVYTN